jgi:hypothetical protein
MHQLHLAGRVVFSDWHNVLSRDPFWASIQQSPRHPLRAQLQAGMAAVFARDQTTADDWMTGRLSSSEVIGTMGISLPRRIRDDFLIRRLDLDCLRMKVNADLFDVLRTVRAEAAVVIATDNMDCFIRAFRKARSRRRSAGPGRSWRTGRPSVTTSSARVRLEHSRTTPRPSSDHGWRSMSCSSVIRSWSTTGPQTARRSPRREGRPSSGS